MSTVSEELPVDLDALTLILDEDDVEVVKASVDADIKELGIKKSFN